MYNLLISYINYIKSNLIFDKYSEFILKYKGYEKGFHIIDNYDYNICSDCFEYLDIINGDYGLCNRCKIYCLL